MGSSDLNFKCFFKRNLVYALTASPLEAAGGASSFLEVLSVAGGTCGSRERTCSFLWGPLGRRRNLWGALQEEPVARCPERAPVLFLAGLSVVGGTCGRPCSFPWGPLGRRRNIWGALGRRRNLWFAAQRGRLFFSLRGCRSQEGPVVPENDHVLFFGGLWVAGGTCGGLWVAEGTCGSLPRESACSFPWGAFGRRRNLWFAAQRGRLFFSLGCSYSLAQALGIFCKLSSSHLSALTMGLGRPKRRAAGRWNGTKKRRHTQHAVNIQSTCSQHVVNTQSTRSQHVVNTQSTRRHFLLYF